MYFREISMYKYKNLCTHMKKGHLSYTCDGVSKIGKISELTTSGHLVPVLLFHH